MTKITKSDFADQIKTLMKDYANGKANIVAEDITRAQEDGVTLASTVTNVDPVSYLTSTDVNAADVQLMCKDFLKYYSRMRLIGFRKQKDLGYEDEYTKYGNVGSIADPTSAGVSTSVYSPIKTGRPVDWDAFVAVMGVVRSTLINNIEKVATTITYCHSSCHSNCHNSRGRR